MNRNTIALVTMLCCAACDAEDEGPPYTIRGEVTMQVEPALGHDGVGTLWLTASRSCAGVEGLTFASVDHFDLSIVGAHREFQMDLPEGGTWNLSMFLDDDGSTSPELPFPFFGDVTNFEDGSALIVECVELDVAGDVEGVEYELDEVF